jgi:opacity protein-like surface antigen
MRVRRGTLLTVLVVAWTAAPVQAQWVAAPYLAGNIAGDVESGKGGPGGSIAYFRDGLGFELDVTRYQHFFKDSEVFPRDPAAPPNCTGQGGPCTDIDTDAMGFMANVVVPFRVQSATKWLPYGNAGLGVIRAWTNEESRHQNDLGFSVGGGVIYWVSKCVGLRGDLRYSRALVDEDNRDGVYATDYGFWRAAAGVTLRFPR